MMGHDGRDGREETVALMRRRRGTGEPGEWFTCMRYGVVEEGLDCPAKDQMSPIRAGALPRAPSGGGPTSTGTTAAGRGRGDLIGRGGPCDGPRRAAGVRC